MTDPVVFSPDFEAPADAGANNVYNVTVSASNGAGLSIVQSYAVTITNVNEPPTFVTGAALSVDENEFVIATINVNDPEAAPLAFSLAGPNAGLFSISAAGELSFGAAPDYEASPFPNNVFSVDVVVSDGVNLPVTQTFNITVNDVNEAPVITSLALAIDENGTTAMNVTATDPEGVAVTFTSTLTGADAALFTITAAGELSFINPPDFENPLDANGDNVYEVTVEATDGVASTQQPITVTVNNVSENPVFTLGATAAAKFDENATGTVMTVLATAGTVGNTVAYTLQGVDSALFSIDR